MVGENGSMNRLTIVCCVKNQDGDSGTVEYMGSEVGSLREKFGGGLKFLIVGDAELEHLEIAMAKVAISMILQDGVKGGELEVVGEERMTMVQQIDVLYSTFKSSAGQAVTRRVHQIILMRKGKKRKDQQMKDSMLQSIINPLLLFNS